MKSIITAIGIMILALRLGYANNIDNDSTQSVNGANNNPVDTTKVIKEGLTQEEMINILRARRKESDSAYLKIDQKYRNPRFRNGDTMSWKRRTGQHGLSIQFDILNTKRFCEDFSDAESKMGIGGSIGFYRFLSEKIACGVNLKYYSYPELTFCWGSSNQEHWSQITTGISLQYIKSPLSPNSLYGKFGVKMAFLSGSRYSSGSFWNGESGTRQKIKTGYTPGIELAIGLMKRSPKNTAGFIEIAYSHLYMKGKNVKIDGKEADWDYPFNLKSLGIRIGGLIPIGGTN